MALIWKIGLGFILLASLVYSQFIQMALRIIVVVVSMGDIWDEKWQSFVM